MRKKAAIARAKLKIFENYDQYVKIHLMLARRCKPTLSDAVLSMLTEADIRIQVEKQNRGIPNAGSHRALDTLVRLTRVIAKLKIKDEADVNDARRAINYYNSINSDIQTSIAVPEDPAVSAFNLILYILQNESNGLPVTLKSLAETACGRDPAVRWYLLQGTKNRLGNVSTNARLRRVKEMLENLSSNRIRRTNMEEAEFMWVGNNDGGGPGKVQEQFQEEKENEGNEQREREEQESENTTITPDATDATDTAVEPRRQQKSVEDNIEDTENQKQDAEKTERYRKTSHHSQNLASAVSAVSAKTQNNWIEEEKEEREREYKILKAMKLARNKYSDEKALGKVGGTMFREQDVWYYLGTMFPRQEYDIERVRKVIQEQIRKRRVLTRQGDPPDIFYLTWSDDRQNQKQQEQQQEEKKEEEK